MDREQFTITSATGVDVALDIAGPGTRSYAFIIDWHIRVLVALAWYLVAALLLVGRMVPEGAAARSNPWVFAAVVPTFAIYFLYHPVLEVVMSGTTPGKRMAGVRVVSEDGGVPSTGALLIRNIFRLIDSLPALYVVGLTTTLLTARRVRVGDLAAGTLLVSDRDSELAALADLSARAGATRLDPQTLELARELLLRWPQLDESKRPQLARTLLARIEPGKPADAFDWMTDRELRGRLETAIGGAVKA
ncbi:MAG TPA: RDD family protein [Candidatus Dormibacteraeota bacterium]|nr:RDD family protein [Candidatus Dormibacteraeota bacterium]